jgi:hypothetical protein
MTLDTLSIHIRHMNGIIPFSTVLQSITKSPKRFPPFVHFMLMIYTCVSYFPVLLLTRICSPNPTPSKSHLNITNYEDIELFHLMGHNAKLCWESQPMCQRNTPPSFLGSRYTASKKSAWRREDTEPALRQVGWFLKNGVTCLDNTDQLRWVVGLLTGHCHLQGHLFKLGLTDGPICKRCLEKDESATHILCDSEAVVYLRIRPLGQFFIEPSDCNDAPISKVLHFIRSVRLIKG